MKENTSSADGLLTPPTAGSTVHKSLPPRKGQKKVNRFADSLQGEACRKGKKKPRKPAVHPYEFKFAELLESAAESTLAAEHLKALIQIQRQKPSLSWRGYTAIPPGTLMEGVCREFERGTNIPLEVPFAHLLGYVAGYLCQRGVHLIKGDDRVDPTIWMVLLADSCAGKTWTTKRIREGCRIDDSEIPGISGSVTAAALFDKIYRQPTGLWLHDEFGQFIARLDKNVQDTEMKEIVLKLYDGQGLARGTKREGERHTGPTRVCVLGMTQHATWHEIMPARSMLDGTAQRFSYLVVQDDPTRHYRDYADWSVESAGWSAQWQQCVRSLQPCYTTSGETINVYKQAFRELAHDRLPQSFYRRLMYSVHRLALIYHVLLGNPSPTLTAADYGWALRLTRLLLEDCVGVVGENAMSDLQRAMCKAQEISKQLAVKGHRIKPRDLIARMRSIKSTGEAEGLIRLIEIAL